ncbi:A/G-specific adenine glycosylase [Legionella sp. W05-934-2]|uniref:A/G-specific adenine glycosylase n=1 Tax=Legionella sp. W05-934-2 TaxID=1198649 RepID=UPI0034634ECC
MINTQFTQPLLTWYFQHGRKDLPWQHPRSPYFVWLSEIMLQQTQVKTVIPYFLRFIERFPTLETLASASIDDVLALWSGLGYYSRARNLYRCAQHIVDDYQGVFPSSATLLATLPGIGESTAAAIASLAFNQPTAILDGNVKRVLCRFFAIDKPPENAAVKRQLWHLAQDCMDKARCADYTQAIMDLGATLCTRAKPSCSQCPIQKNCQAFAKQMVDRLPIRQLRAKIPTREGHFILLHHHSGDIYIQKNPDKGVWGGLWSLPQFKCLQDSHHWLEHTWGVNPVKAQPDYEFKHTFSHFHLQLKIYHYHTDKALYEKEKSSRWLSVDDLNNVGLPKPIHVILNQYWRQPNEETLGEKGS